MDKILITGTTGFIGQELVKKLIARKAEIHTVELHTIQRYVTGRYSLDKQQNVTTHHANLTDYTAIKTLIKKVQPDYVLHLAAISAVSYSYDHYVEVTDADYTGTVNLAEACYREVPNFKQFIFAGTSEEYGLSILDKKAKLTEDSELKPNSPYAVAKVAADLYLRYMGAAYNFPFTILRPFNTYGRKDNKHFFIERTITQMLGHDKVLLGDPTTTRDWVYVDDHVDAYVKAVGNKKAIGQIIQISSGKGYTTKETAEMIAKMTGFKGEIAWNSTQARPLDAKVLIGDNKKAKELIGWEPKHTLEQGLKKTIDYWKGKENQK